MTPGAAPRRWCEACGNAGAPGARFCGACGRPLGGAAHPAGSPEDAALEATPKLAGRPHAGAVTAEQDVLAFKALPVQTLLQLVLCILTLGIAWLFLWVHRSHVRYRITTHRLEIRSGIVTVLRRNVDLHRIQDIEVREPLFLRMRGGGDLTIRSLDPGEPELTIAGIGDVHRVHETLRGLVADERRRQGVRLIEEQS